jgi:hypothetical protein
LAVRDQREDVVSGDDKESIVGHQRSLYGIPFDVQTASYKPFATELAQLIAKAISAKGQTVQVVTASPFKREDVALQGLVGTGADRLLLFTVIDWNADTYSETTLNYDLRVAVYDRSGRKLGESSAKGEDELKANGRPERRTVPAATADIVATLLTDKPVVAALSGEAAPKEKQCTVDQILKMQESGLSQDQIEAACGSH